MITIRLNSRRLTSPSLGQIGASPMRKRRKTIPRLSAACNVPIDQSGHGWGCFKLDCICGCHRRGA